MKNYVKKIVSVLLALAMVVTGLNYTPSAVSAADETLPTSQEVTELKAPKKAYLCDFRMSDGKYKIVFEDADAENYTVAPGDTKTFDVYLGAEKKVTVSKSGENVDISDWGFEDGKVYEITVKQVLTRATADGGTETLESKASAVNYFTYTEAKANPIDTGIAKVFVNTTRDEATKDWNLYKQGLKQDVKAALVVQNEDGTINVANSGTIKLRGNSTSTGQKKPYNIKFDKKEDVFGFGKAKKWSLLANTFDRSLIRNQIGVQFHQEIMEANQKYQYTSMSKPVDFYLDGKYLGSYLILESVETGETRVDLDDENPDNHEILLELDGTDRDVGTDAHLDAHTTLMNMGFTMNGPEGPGLDAMPENHPDHAEWVEFNNTYAAKKKYTLDYLNNFEQLIADGGDGTLDDIEKVIDVDSFVNYYITAELFRITDIAFSSVRYFIKQEPDGSEKLYAGALWDLDLSSGNSDGAAANPDNDMHAQDNPWFGALMKNKEFKARVTERFNQVLPDINSLVSEGGRIDKAVAALEKSAEANYSSQAYNAYDLNEDGTSNGWAANKIYTAGEGAYDTEEAARASGSVSGSLVIHNTWQEYVADYKAYMIGRIKYLKKQFDATDYEEVLTDITDQMGSYAYNLAKKKPATVYKSLHREGKLEYLNDGEVNNGVFCGITNADSPEGNGTIEGEPVYATIDLGKYYDAKTIDQVVVQYKDGSDNDTVLNRAYSILYSIDGKQFREVASTEKAILDENNRTIDIVSDTTGIVRYVRLYFPKQSTYGMHIREFAVLDTDKNAVTFEEEEVAPITNLVLTAPEDNKIGVSFEASETENVRYQIYVDDKLTIDNAVAGEVNLINDLKAGQHTVMVQVINAKGFVSEEVSDIIQVTGIIVIEDLVKDPTANLAYQKSVTLDSGTSTEPENTPASVLTDGIISESNYCTPSKGQAGHNESWYTIDLGTEYEASGIDMIYVWYRLNYGGCYPETCGYDVQYSTDGEQYTTVAQVSLDELRKQHDAQNTSPFSVSIDVSEQEAMDSVRYVRVYYPNAVTYGAQTTEVGVFDTDGDATEFTGGAVVDVPASITATSDKPNTITVTLEGAATHDDYTYEVTVAGVTKKNVLAGETIVFENVAAGTYVVTAKSVDAEGNKSKAIESKEVKVENFYNCVVGTKTDAFAATDKVLGNNYIQYEYISAQSASNIGDSKADNAIDNDPNTKWESIHDKDPQEYTVDLGDTYSITGLAIRWDDTSAKDYTVEISNDNKEWTTVATIENIASQKNRLDTITFKESVNAQYVKVNGTARSAGYGYSIWDIAVYGPDAQKNGDRPFRYTHEFLTTNIAFAETDAILGNNYVHYDGVKATASSGDAKNAIDQNAESSWTSEASDPQSIIVSLGNKYTITGLAMTWRIASAKDYTVEVSDDDETWTKVAWVTAGKAGDKRLDKIAFDEAVEAKYVKINGTARTTPWEYSIYEMAIYGPDANRGPEQILDSVTDWIEVSDNDGNHNISTAGTRYYVSQEFKTENINTAVFGLYSDHTIDPKPPHHNEACTIKGAEYVAAVETVANQMQSVWIDGIKYVSGTENCYINGNQVYLSQDLFALAEDETEKIFAVTIRATNMDLTYALKVEKLTYYNVSVDGTATPIAEGGKFKLPTEATYGYFDGTNMHKAGAEVTVTSDMAFTSVNTLSVSVMEGAGIRLEENAGLRFQATVTSDNMAAVDSEAIKEGMLITAKDLFESNQSTLDITSGYTKANIVNSGWYKETLGTYCGSIVNLVEVNYVRNFVARAYVTINYKVEETTEPVTYYSDMTGYRNVCDIANIIKGKENYDGLLAYKDIIDKYAAAK